MEEETHWRNCKVHLWLNSAHIEYWNICSTSIRTNVPIITLTKDYKLNITYQMKKLYCILLFITIANASFSQNDFLKFEPVGFSQVNITDNFWKPKLQLVSSATLKACVYQTEIATPRIKNFENVANKKPVKHQGIFYDDSDVFKALEAIAYSLKTNPNDTLEKKADEWIGLIAASQQSDGYLNTFYTLNEPEKRYSDMSMHEDYNAGHMIEAAVAYFNATGKRTFLDVATRWANHFDKLFGPGKRHWVTGHQELELALVKLYKTTNDQKYLQLADWLLSERGHGYAKGYTWTEWKDTAYAQDVVPVKQQKEITGHAVRAMYMYTGAADVAAQTGDVGYMKAMDAVWQDVVYRNMYITGGIGSSGSNEGFSKDYDLPNEQAYCETCASVGMVFWNQRMNTLTGDAKYFDVLEKSLYNGALDGLSLTGDRFFYGNPLASMGTHKRREWFGTACCPSNIARLIASLGNYIYAKNDNSIVVNLFVGSDTKMMLKNGEVGVKMETNYPLDGYVKVHVDPSNPSFFTMRMRKPGWSSGTVVPGDLYYYHSSNAMPSKITILINGQPVSAVEEKGYYVINRVWKKGDIIDYTLAMDVKRVVSKEDIKANNGRVALQRGPLVYCFEGADNDGKVWDIILPDSTSIDEKKYKVLDENVVALTAQLPTLDISPDGQSVKTVFKKVVAIPYYSWCNRGSNPMQVWLPTKIHHIRVD